MNWWTKLLASYAIYLAAFLAADLSARYFRRRGLRKMVGEERFQKDLKESLDRAFAMGVEVGRARERKEAKAFNN